MQKNRDALVQVLSVLEEEGVLPHIILVGSWAEFLYGETSVLESFSSLGKTTDMDFLIRNLKKPNKVVSIVAAMQAAGFTYAEDSITGCSKFFNDVLEIEFLICQKGDGSKTLPRTNIGVNAQQLTHMDIANNHMMTVNYEGFEVNIPTPEAYIIQKMIINDRRKIKMIPDQEKIRSILPHIDIDKFNEVFAGLTKKERQSAEKYINEHVSEYKIEGGIVVRR